MSVNSHMNLVMLNHAHDSWWLLHRLRVMLIISLCHALVALHKGWEQDQVIIRSIHILMELQVQVNSREAIPPKLQDKVFQSFAKLRTLTRIVLSSTSEANSLAVAITLLKYQLTILICSSLPSMLSHQKVFSLSFRKRKLKTFWRNSKMTMNRWLRPYRSWISALSFWILNSSNKDALERHQPILEADKNCPTINNLRMHRRVRNKRSRIFKSRTMASKRSTSRIKR